MFQYDGLCFNDITTKDKMSGKITYDWGEGRELGEHLLGTLKRADDGFRQNFPASRIVFCPLVGCELSRVVNSHSTSEADQLAVDNAIWVFNEEVFNISNRRNTFSPALHHQVHRFCKGTRHSYYHHLPDGIHLSKLLKKKWAQNFVKAMARN